MHPVQDELGFGVRLNLFLRPPFIPSASASATVHMTHLPAGSDITKVTVFLGDNLVA